MLKQKNVIPLIFLLLVGITFFSCKYDKAENKPCSTSVPETVSFSHDVKPLFRTYCSTTDCHSGTNPQGNLNLEDTSAYAALMKPGSGYIDTLNPNFSLLYTQMNSSSQVMPPSGKLDDCKINLILKWIEQKAKNN